MKSLTSKQKEILKFIQSYIDQHHYPPTYREIMTHFGLMSTGSIDRYIKTLQKKGALTFKKQIPRSVNLTDAYQSLKEPAALSLPLIGNLSFGYPPELFINPTSLSVPSAFVVHPEHTYVLQNQGDSLREEGIHHRDYLIIESRNEIQAGEIILGIINHQDTILKRYYSDGEYIRLESLHFPQPQFLTVRRDHISIQGVMTGLLRSY